MLRAIRQIGRLAPSKLHPSAYLVSLTQKRCRLTVRHGPFAGMRYVEGSVGSAYIPKLLGIYERELHPIVEAACGLGLQQVVDLGAAEGYYAVGMALRNPETRVVAFEADRAGRELLGQMVAINGVADRVEIAGRCEQADLHDRTMRSQGRTLIVCDVEGDEERLLSQASVQSCGITWLLVELHEFLSPEIGARLTSEFASTHRITRIWQDARERAEFPFRSLCTRLLPTSYLDWAVSEWRPERMSWLWMEPRAAEHGRMNLGDDR
jgi:hypothetical protein